MNKFMFGRNGPDKLNLFIAVIILIMGIVSIFANSWIFSIVQLLVLALFVFRFLSKNTAQRYKENQKFCSVADPVVKKLRSVVSRIKDTSHKYYKCPKCSAKLRVPKGKGSITITCSVCRSKFDKKT